MSELSLYERLAVLAPTDQSWTAIAAQEEQVKWEREQRRLEREEKRRRR